MEHLKVTFSVISPILAPTLGTHLYLDGLLSHAQVGLMSNGCAHGEELQELLDTLPIDRHQTSEGGPWVYKASRLFFEHETNPRVFGANVVAMTKKLDVDAIANLRIGENFELKKQIKELKEKRAEARRLFRKNGGVKPPPLDTSHIKHRIDPILVDCVKSYATGSGQYRNWLFKTRGWLAQKVHAYAVGDAENVLELAKCIGFIGKKSVNGYGTVDTDKTTVEVVSPEECRWYVRNMPEPIAGKESDYLRTIGNLRAPYWDRRNNQPLYVHQDAA